MIIYPDKCIYRSYVESLDWLDLTIPNYVKKLGCEDCRGNQDCKLTLAELIELHEHYKKELGDLL